MAGVGHTNCDESTTKHAYEQILFTKIQFKCILLKDQTFGICLKNSLNLIINGNPISFENGDDHDRFRNTVHICPGSGDQYTSATKHKQYRSFRDLDAQ